MPEYRVNKIFHPDGKCDAWEVQVKSVAYDGGPYWKCLTKEPFSRASDAAGCLEALCRAESLRGVEK